MPTSCETRVTSLSAGGAQGDETRVDSVSVVDRDTICDCTCVTIYEESHLRSRVNSGHKYI